MVSVLKPETLAVLRAHRAAEPMFHNPGEAEAFEAAHTARPFKVVRCTDGLFAVLDLRKHWSCQTVATEETLAHADSTMRRLADRASASRPEAP